jgi:hypothetical protein
MDTTTIVDRYLAIWNETDPDRRRALIDETWAEDGRYTDPVFASEGPDAIDGIVGAFHQQFPGLTFVHTGEIEHHHDRIRFTWDLLDAAGERQAAGTDVAAVAPDGRLADVAGFFDLAPVLPDAVPEGVSA